MRAVVTKVEQFLIRNNEEAIEIMRRYSISDLGVSKIPKEVLSYIRDKRYAIFVHFGRVERVKPFKIDKKGFGSQAAWIVVNDINNIKL